MWGRVKTTGENWMYPKPVLDLRLVPCDYRLIICGSLHHKLSCYRVGGYVRFSFRQSYLVMFSFEYLHFS